ncbi:MAG: ABC transporter ATP-binding protein [Bacillota bacterium]
MGLKIIVNGLELRYGAYPVLDGVDFTVRRGDLLALLGANGAGKSTLLRCISKILAPSDGQIRLNGREARFIAAREAARLMAVVSQEQAVDFDFTVEEVVRMGRLPYLKRFQKEGEEDEVLARRAMEMTGVSHLAGRTITALSGGEKQRVLMARAVCQEPEALLLDEPTANLDIGYQASLLELAARLNREKGVTVIAAIHDLNLAVQHFDRFMLLAGGRVLAAGRAEEVITAENIRRSYGVPAFVYRHPLYGVLQVSVAKRPPAGEVDCKALRVHVIGGGEEALPALELLHRAGLSLSVSPVSIQDSGCRFAQFHRLPVVEVPPFSAITDVLHQEHLQLIRRAGAVVVPPVPFGEGNLRCLAAVEQALKEDAVVFVLEPAGISERDFSGGRATELLARLLREGARPLPRAADLLEAVAGRSQKL